MEWLASVLLRFRERFECLRVDGTYEMGARQYLGVFALSLAMSVVVYSVALNLLYSQLTDSYRTADVFVEMSADDPMTISSDALSRESKSASRQWTLDRVDLEKLIMALGLSSPVPLNDQAELVDRAIRDVLTSRRGPTTMAAQRDGSVPTLSLVVALIQRVGSSNAAGSAAEFNSLHSSAIAAAMANPSVRFAGKAWADLYLDLATQEALGPISVSRVDGTLHEHTRGFPGVWAALSLNRNERAAEAQLIKPLLLSTQIIGPRAQQRAVATDSATMRAFAIDLSLALIGKVYSSPRAKRAAGKITLIHGPEQFVLCIIFIALVQLFFLRFLGYLWQLDLVKNVEDQVKSKAEPSSPAKAFSDKKFDGTVVSKIWNGSRFLLDRNRLHSFFAVEHSRVNNSRWAIRWGARALPAIGFIGTARGILNSLSNADSIVRAASASGQSAAISHVSNFLGLSFSTTLVGLGMSLLVLYVNDYQVSCEVGLLDRLEQSLLRVNFPDDVGQVAP